MTRVIQRKVEASVGKTIFKLIDNRIMKKSKICSKAVFLPKAGITMYYLEGNDDYDEEEELDRPTLLFCHGITDQAKNLCTFISSLNIPSNVRILIPDAIGHGKDVERFFRKKNEKQHVPPPNTPTSMDLLNSTIEFLEVLKVKHCNAFGVSMGGALAYYLRYKRPDLCYKTVLVSPAIIHSLGKQFVDEFQSGQKNHFCFESRQDVKVLMRDLASYPPSKKKKKKNPIPKFFLEAIFQLSNDQPKGHFRKVFESFLEDRNNNDEDLLFMVSDRDIDKYSPRLVIWPENDYICNYKKGEEFFENSSLTTFQSIPNCGHVFHDDKRGIYDVILPLLQATEYLLDFDQKGGVDNMATTRGPERIEITTESSKN